MMSPADFEAARLARWQIEHGQAAGKLRRKASLDSWAAAFSVGRGSIEHWLADIAEIERDRGTSARRTALRWEDVDEDGGDDER